MSWGEILKAINKDPKKSLDTLIDEKIKTILSEILSSKNTINSGILNLSSNTQSMLNNPKVVKSVQRGEVNFSMHFDSYTVNISRVNIQKSILILNTGYPGSNSYLHSGIGTLNNSSIILKPISYSGGYYYYNHYWQVIEFY